MVKLIRDIASHLDKLLQVVKFFMACSRRMHEDILIGLWDALFTHESIVVVIDIFNS